MAKDKVVVIESDGPFMVLGMIWLASWLAAGSPGPWWHIALSLTLGYAVVKLIRDISRKRSKEPSHD